MKEGGTPPEMTAARSEADADQAGHSTREGQDPSRGTEMGAHVRTIESRWCLIVFGVMIGLLAALSTAAGTTVTLLGLLFALIGGSFFDWFNPSRMSDTNRPLLLAYSGSFATGFLLGLISGIAFRWYDQRYLQPEIAKIQIQTILDTVKNSKDIDVSIAKNDKSNYEINNLSSKPSLPPVADASNQKFAENIAIKVLDRIRPSGELHSASSNKMREIANLLSADSAVQGLDPKVKKDLSTIANDLIEIANILKDPKHVDELKKNMKKGTRQNFEEMFK